MRMKVTEEKISYKLGGKRLGWESRDGYIKVG